MVPKRLQAVLWSVGTDQLDLQRDKDYIVHQILAYGRWEDIKWLFKAYEKNKIKDVFVKHPSKDYYPAGFNFVSKILLGVGDVNFQKYDRFAPRVIG